MTRRLVAALCLTAVVCVLAARADDRRPVTPPADKKDRVKDADDIDPKARIEEAASQQERLRHQFEEFKQSLLRLKQRLESSSKPEDRDKARILDEALARASEQGTDSKFSTLVAALKGSDAFKDLDQLSGILDKNEDLRKDIRMLIELLLRDDREAQIKKEHDRLSRMLEQLKEVILKQEKTRAQTEMGRKNADELEKLQKKVTEDTKNLVARGDDKDKKGSGKDSKKSDGKTGKSGEPKDGKSGEKKDGKSGEPKDGKSGEPKDGKSGEKKDGKPGEPKDGKSGEPKEGKSGEPKDGKSGEPKHGQQGDSQQADKQDQQQQESNPFKKQIEEVNKHQKGAEKDLKEKKNPDAVSKQDKALEELNKVKKRLEDLLKQLREEEIERMLAALQARCERMLAMQVVIRDGTVALDKDIDKKEATREQQQTSNVLSDREDEIIREASKAISVIQAEGSALAFAEVFLQVRGDMTTVAARLRRTDAGTVTQTIENDIIATLQEMIEALKKARKDNKSPPQPPKAGQQGQPGDQRLIDMLAELKMIRSMQLRVNSRTEVYGKQYEGEQVPAPALATDAKLREQYEMIQRELRELAERQLKIEKVTSDIAKGKNKAN
jgi:hypothetical protein